MKIIDNIKRWWTNKVENKQIEAEQMKDLYILTQQINAFMNSPKRFEMLKGEMYYKGFHDINNKQRTAIGRDGSETELKNIPNNRILDNQYRKLVDQKVNYVLGKAISFNCEDKAYLETAKTVFNLKFNKIIKNMGKSIMNSGIAYLYIYYNDLGELKFKKLNGFEVIPNWLDEEHTELKSCLRLYKEMEFDGSDYVEVFKAENYTVDGVEYFIYKEGRLYPDKLMGKIPYIVNTLYNEETQQETKEFFNWGKLPIIPFKFNDDEIPLLRNIKTLQDGINTINSLFADNMQEDSYNTILVLKNYAGENLAEFRHNLAAYRAIKTETYDGKDGGVESLNIEVNSENYKAILEIFKAALIENGRGLDSKDDRLSGNPNQMNIQSMYSDLDLDANEMETEFQASFEDLLFFVNKHLGVTPNDSIEVIFDRTLLINQSQTIEDCKNSVGILSNETIIAQHPFVKDVQQELDRIKKEKDEQMQQLETQYNMNPSNSNGDLNGTVNQ